MKEELYKKHLEAIDSSNWIDFPNQTNTCLVATKCASITEKYGEIKRLEGMIEVIKEGSLDQANRLRLYGLEKQLEQLKKEL